jgi:acetylornithine/N-succinyldiaminopimelate aminotransferase
VTSAEIVAMTQRHQMENYARYPVAFVRGEGARLFDAEGREYLDLLGGIAVALLGHSHPRVVDAVCGQAKALTHVSNLFHVPVQAELGRLLSGAAGGGKVFFCNSGTEANEAAIKLARKWAHDGAKKGAREFVVVEGSFHGRTYGGLSATAQPKLQQGFEPMLPGFRAVPFGEIAALERALTEAVCAFLVEPVQGESGVRVHPPGYLERASALCRELGILFVADEIQSGMGRTGAFLASSHFGIAPDIATFAKGLANGLPLGAVVAREDVASAFGPGTHGSTFGGNPVCCAASKVVLETVLAPGFLPEVSRKGGLLRTGLEEIARDRSDVREVRGMGLMVGMEMEIEVKETVKRCLAAGLVVGTAGEKVLRFLPPLTVTEEEIRRGLAILAGSLPEEGRR